MNLWQWYRLRTRRLKIGLGCGSLLVVFLLGLGLKAALGSVDSANSAKVLPVHSAETSSRGAAVSSTVQVIAHLSTPTPAAEANPSPVASRVATPAQLPAIYYGVHVPEQNLAEVTAFEAAAHKPVAMVMWYQNWGNTDGYQNFQPVWMDSMRSHGSIPLVTWEPWNPSQGVNQPAYSLQNILAGHFDAYITAWALASKAWGYPYFLRFAHEMNGNWNPWSEQVNGNKPGQFVQAWRHVHDIFTSLGVTNVTWVWTPNIDYSTGTPLRELYPGDSYVDWVGMSGYNWGTLIPWHNWQSFSSIFGQTYQELTALTSKPVMIAEMASTEEAGNKASWITDTYTVQLPSHFPRIKAVIWFDEDKETDWRIESSVAAQSAFASAIQSSIYRSNIYASLNVSPIPPP